MARKGWNGAGWNGAEWRGPGAGVAEARAVPRGLSAPAAVVRAAAAMLLLAAWVLIAALAPARAQTAEDTAIRGVISGQIAAFQADDLGTAFGFASPMIKGIFGTPENFGAMVQQGYPMVWRPADVRFLDLRPAPDGLWQRVMIRDGAGALHFLEYQMIPGPQGAGWQINAVRLLPAPGMGA